MNLRSTTHDVAIRPQGRGWLALCLLVCAGVAAAPTSAHAQPKKGPTPGPSADKGDKDKGGKPKVFDFTGLDINGRLRTPQLLYFLERANEELEAASLERRSFIPELVRTVDEEAL